MNLNLTPFTEWALRPELKSALAAQDFETPTPVQQEAFPLVMEGNDLLVQSRTGTGKTLAFGLPLLERLGAEAGPVEAIVVLPTRELALQVGNTLGRLARSFGVEVAVLYGGGNYRDQMRSLNQGARVVVGTPGRLVDHLERGSLKLGQCRTLVLDEADEILDMGFAEELNKVLDALPEERQSLLFSATMSPEMRVLAEKTLKNPKTLSVSTGLATAPTIEHVAYEVFREHRNDALMNVLHAERPELAIIFCHTKAETEELAEKLESEGFKSSFLNGDLPQAQRTKTLNAFRRRQINLLVATDVAARGIDVKGVSHVFNLGVPQNPETYVHRTGRTGRAGASGIAVTLVVPRDSARFRRMLQSTGAKLEFKPLPQADDVRARLRERYHEKIVDRITKSVGEPWKPLADELLAYLDPAELVAALLAGDDTARAVLEAGLDVAVPSVKRRSDSFDKPEKGAKGPKKPRVEGEEGPLLRDGKGPQRKLSDHQEAGMTRLYLNQGKAHKLMPGRLVQLVCSTSGIKGEAIGAIAIHPYFCFFDVREGDANRVVQALDGLQMRGKRLKANIVT